ncbi:IclR family transcriptional regulator [Shinella sp. CPCC 100929]|uniref:IclR family transcriptional regulator n=1 Tax=Shinella lacus TaxID=2654216 RepID=A0ABT1R1J9_9HYPH|nr:IclR family transcriptional regulator [Shinella lacus]MCQ4629031.1 IclR family transcriptional regulator [Shinella lacus]
MLKDQDITAIPSGKGWEKYLEVAAPQGAQGTVRIAALLRIVAAYNAAGMKISEVADLARLEQPTAHRIVTALHSVGFLSRNPETRRYHLGPLLFELFTTAFPHFNIRDVCLPSMKTLAEDLGDTVYLTVRSGFDGICVERQEGSYPIRTCTVDVGRKRPLGIGAGSLALLAAHSASEAETIIEHNRDRYTPFNTSAEAVQATVEKIRAQGFIYQDVLNTPEIKTVALAITGHTGHPFAGLSITAIATRIPEERATVLLDHLRQRIKQIADLISEQGYV